MAWLGWLSGIVYVALFLSDIFLTPGEPDEGTSPTTVASYYTRHRSHILTTSLLHDLSGIFFLIFVACLLTLLWQTGHRTLTVLAGIGAVAAGSVAYGSYVAAGAAAFLAGHSASAGEVAALAELRYLASNVAVLPLSLFIGAASLVALGRTVLPGWLGWLGVVAAAANIVSIFGLYDGTSIFGLVGFLGAILFAVWMLATCIVLLVKRSSGQIASALHGATTLTT